MSNLSNGEVARLTGEPAPAQGGGWTTDAMKPAQKTPRESPAVIEERRKQEQEKAAKLLRELNQIALSGTSNDSAPETSPPAVVATPTPPTERNGTSPVDAILARFQNLGERPPVRDRAVDVSLLPAELIDSLLTIYERAESLNPGQEALQIRLRQEKESRAQSGQSQPGQTEPGTDRPVGDIMRPMAINAVEAANNAAQEAQIAALKVAREAYRDSDRGVAAQLAYIAAFRTATGKTIAQMPDAEVLGTYSNQTADDDFKSKQSREERTANQQRRSKRNLIQRATSKFTF